ncbi:MAG: acetate/propionate family kinase [Methylomonas sp.]
MKILVLNAGSSSVKYCLFEMTQQTLLMTGLIERIGESTSTHHYRLNDAAMQHVESAIANHQQALQELFSLLSASGVLSDSRELSCIGHRVVHGGEQFRQPALVNEHVLQQIEATIALAPLHNPANLLGIQEAMRQISDIPQVAVFDTAFHQTLPDYAYRYALPTNLYTEHGVRRYGFHGTSHRYVAGLAAEFLGKPLEETNLITLHLGNGASVTAIRNGQSIDTSMGMTPLEGLMMGTRCGDIDPAIHFYLGRTLNMPNDAIESMMNKSSGCKGVCGENDMRAIHKLAEAGNDDARLALDMYAYRIKKYIGAYFAVLGHVDALVFTGGIGENDSKLREQCCANLSALGIGIDSGKNQNHAHSVANIGSAGSTVAVLVIATHEELEIAIQAQQCLENRP